MTVKSGERIRAGPALAPAAFASIRREMELVHCKWDAHVGDVTTLAPFPLLLDAGEWSTLASAAESLTTETLAIERELFRRPSLWPTLGLPRRLRRLFRGARMPTPPAARVMRFDFHLTPEGWRVSEVNSDVPGGYTEATAFTQLVARAFGGAKTCGDPTAALVRSIVATVGAGGRVMLVNAPGHMEDHQVVAYLARRLEELRAWMRVQTGGEHSSARACTRRRDRALLSSGVACPAAARVRLGASLRRRRHSGREPR